MSTIVEALDGLALRIARVRYPWWGWPALLVGMGVFAVTMSLLLHPGPHGEFVHFPDGTKFGDTCAFLLVAGVPCPQCGMTRSWVHAVRLDLWTGFWYSPAGFALFWWVIVGSFIGAVRLIKRDPKALRVPWGFNVGWSVFWLVGLYLGPWILRLFGVNPLP